MLSQWPSTATEIVQMEGFTSVMIATTYSDDVTLAPYTASCKVAWILACTKVFLSV